MATPPEKITKHAFDWSPFPSAKRDLEADRSAWIETSYLIAEIRRNSREPIPDVVLAHLEARLDGTAKKGQGRGRRTPDRKLHKMLIAAAFERRLTWLRWREQSSGLEGWKAIRSAEWWQGPPSERAARMVRERWAASMSWETVRNIAYAARKVSRKGIHGK